VSRPLALCALLLLPACSQGGRDGIVPPASAQRQAENAALATSRRTAVVDAANRVAPAVVSINVTSRRKLDRGPWDFFFIPRESEQLVQSSGTGFIVKPDGVVITNQHVVAGAETITVTLPDGTDLAGKLVGEDPTTDIAHLRALKQVMRAGALRSVEELAAVASAPPPPAK